MAKIGKAASYLRNKANSGANAVTDFGINAAVTGGKYASRGLVKKVDKNIYNGYTGLKTTGFATVAAFGAAGVWGKATYEGTKDKKMMETVQADYIGAAPVQNYDGVSSAPTLGASGNMVFGMHNARRG